MKSFDGMPPLDTEHDPMLAQQKLVQCDFLFHFRHVAAIMKSQKCDCIQIKYLVDCIKNRGPMGAGLYTHHWLGVDYPAV